LGSRKTTPSAHEPLISWESVADVPLAGLSSTWRFVAEPRVGGREGVGVNRHGCRNAQQSLDLGKKDLREGPDGRRPVGEKTSQPLRHGDHPLPHGHRRDDVIGEMSGGL